MSDFKDMTTDSKPWAGNKIKPMTIERFREVMEKVFLPFFKNKIEEEEREKEEREKSYIFQEKKRARSI